jgi:hypothetical protein
MKFMKPPTTMAMVTQPITAHRAVRGGAGKSAESRELAAKHTALLNKAAEIKTNADVSRSKLAAEFVVSLWLPVVNSVNGAESGIAAAVAVVVSVVVVEVVVSVHVVVEAHDAHTHTHTHTHTHKHTHTHTQTSALV